MKKSRNPHKAVVLFKYFPVVTATMMYVHVILLILGANPPVADKFAGMSVIGTMVAYVASRELGFCRVHRNMVLYTVAVDTCIWIQKYWGFGDLRQMLHVVAFLFGTAIFIDLIICRRAFCHETCGIVQEVRKLDAEKVG